MTTLRPAEAYPLYWPEGWARTRRRKAALYRVSPGKAYKDLRNELRLFNARDAVISSNVPLRVNGVPHAQPGYVDDPGVAVYFVRRGDQQVIACDRFNAAHDNMRAVHKTIEALRAMERAGATQVLAKAFEGFKALPAAEQRPVERPWWEVLDLPTASLASLGLDLASGAVKQRVRNLSREAHPDAGGSDEAMAEINRAADEAIAWLTHESKRNL